MSRRTSSRRTSVGPVLVALAAVVALALALPTGPARAGILPPVAIDDAGSVVHGQTRTVAPPGVLGNDVYIGDGYTAVLVSGPSHGEVDLDADGGYTYDADMDYAGADQFRYRVDGGLLGLSNIATVRITVTNVAPVARADSYAVVAGNKLTVEEPGLLANDSDTDGDKLTVEILSDPDEGDLEALDDGSFTYQVGADFSGVVTFRYRVWDGVAWSSAVTVTITVTAPPPTPTPRPTPTPTPRPTSTPTPTPSGTPTPTPRPTTTPSGSPLPGESARPSPTPGGGSPSPGATDGSGRPAASVPPLGAGGPGGDPGSPGGGTGALASPDVARGAGPFSVPQPAGGVDLPIDTSFAGFGGFEWAVPAMVLTVPALLLIVAVVMQAAMGIAFIPLVRRWLGGDRRRRRGSAGRDR